MKSGFLYEKVRVLIAAFVLLSLIYFLVSRLMADGQGAIDQDQTAKEIYDQYCSNCHGTDLRGGNAQSLLDGVWQFGDGPGYVNRNIKFGIPHLGMPSYEQSLTDQEIRLLVDYLYAEQMKAGVSKPDPPPQLESIDYTIRTDIWVDELDLPWAIVFLNSDTALITERPGRLRMVVGGKLLAEAVQGTPEVLNEGQGGLLDVNIDPRYAENGWVYLSYSHRLEPGQEDPETSGHDPSGEREDQGFALGG